MRILIEALAGRQTGPAASFRLFALFLLTIFTVELLVMTCLPSIVTSGMTTFASALLDASVLTLAVTPLAWWLFVQPLHRLHAARGKLLEGIIRVQEKERRRIARDLHDGVGQELTAVLLRLRVLESQMQGSDLRDNVTAIRAGTSAALEGLRRLVRETRPPVLDSLGLVAALEKLLQDVHEASGISTSLFRNEPAEVRLTPDVEVALYRIIQEAVTNAVRHSGCGRIEVALDLKATAFVATVADDGSGLDESAVSGGAAQPFGIMGMRERADQIGGGIEFERRPGGGTLLRVRVPLQRAEEPPGIQR